MTGSTKQRIGLLVVIAAAVALAGVLLVGGWQWVLVLPAGVLLLWGLQSPYRCLLLMVFAFPFERVGNIELPWFKIKPFQLFAALTVFTLVVPLAFGRKQFPRVPRHPLLLWLAVFHVANVIAYLFSENPDDLRPLAHYALFIIIAVLVAMLVTTREQLAGLIQTVALSGAFAAAYGLLQGAGYLAGWETAVRATPLTFVGGESPGVRVVSLYYDPNLFASFLCLTIPLGLAYYQAATRRWQQLLSVAAVLVMLLALAATYSRSGFWGAIAGLLVFMFLQKSARSRMKAFLLLGIFFLLGWGALAIWGGDSIGPDTVWGRALAIEQGVSERTFAWHQILGAFYDHPLVGVGPAEATNWNTYIPDLFSSWDITNLRIVAHNIFLDVAVGTGLLGFVPFAVLVWLALWRGWQCFRHSEADSSAWELGILSALVAVLANGLSMTTLMYPFLWLLFGLAVAGEQIAGRTVDERVPGPRWAGVQPRWSRSQP